MLLEIIAISFTIQNHSFHKSKFVNSANFFTGGVYNRINYFKEYATLRKHNKELLEENTRLKNVLAREDIETSNTISGVIDSTKYFQKYLYTPAKVIDNQYHKKYNFLTINKGNLSGIDSDQAVINSKGIVGITQTVSENFTTVLSILNENSKINIRLINSLHFGTLQWNGKDYKVLQLVDLPIQANIKKGDTLITGGKSIIFPEGIPVGVIDDFKIKNNNYEIINIKLFNDMTAIGPVNVIISLYKDEVNQLLDKTNE